MADPLGLAQVPDKVSPAVRRRTMQAVRSKNTALELSIRRALWAAGVRGWRCHSRDVFGKPDLSWKGKRVAVFIDSAWWHGHASRWTPGKLSPWWDAKIARNRARDALVNDTLQHQGWTVLRIWDFEVAQELPACVDRVRAAITEVASPRRKSERTRR